MITRKIRLSTMVALAVTAAAAAGAQYWATHPLVFGHHAYFQFQNLTEGHYGLETSIRESDPWEFDARRISVLYYRQWSLVVCEPIWTPLWFGIVRCDLDAAERVR